jgi:hypothetical protein
MRWDGSRGGEGTLRAGDAMPGAWAFALSLLAWLALSNRPSIAGDGDPPVGPSGDGLLFARMALPDAWRARFWQSAEGRALLKLQPRALADLVPAQSGARFCRCPACGAEERDDPLGWSIEHPAVLKCRRCGIIVPDDKYPAKVNKEIPEEKVEVVPGVLHHYPYHAVEEEKARYPDERLYLRARIDYEARKFLSKAALYCAAESAAQPPARRDPRLAILASTILLRFAQVYPAYATHLDQPELPKIFQPARLNPPYRRGYRTGKWEWNGSLEVPMNLVMAYSLLRGSPSWAEAGKLLGESHPERTVEADLLRASAEHARSQPEEFSEDSLHIDRGIFAVGRVLGDPQLEADALTRLDHFLRRGFYHDGFWRGAGIESHRRVLGLIESWVGEAAPGDREVRRASTRSAGRQAETGSDRARSSMLELARQAGAAIEMRGAGEDVRQVSWPSVNSPAPGRRPVLLGGAGLARLAVGEGQGALDVEVLGVDSYSGAHFQRLAIRLAIAGRPVLDDLDEQAATANGWELATASHNAVLIDGVNQRETPAAAAVPAAGGNFLFFAADPDFQVVSVDDPSAYPNSATRYRHTLVATAGPRSRYVLSVFEVHGGLQHDQIYHAAPGSRERWLLSVPTRRPPPSLLPPSITFLSSARPEQGRWFVQSYGEFRLESQGELAGPALAGLVPPGEPANPRLSEGARTARTDTRPTTPLIRLHLLGDPPMTAFTATSGAPPAGGRAPGPAPSDDRRASLIVRRKSNQGETLNSTFVTLFEPAAGGSVPLRRVGRVGSSPDVIVVLVESADGEEHLLVNLKPGTDRRVQLPSGRYVSFDGLALRVREGSLVMAGGKIAEGSGKLLAPAAITGTLSGSVRLRTERGRGWFLTADPLPADPAVAGRTLIVQHGDGTCHSWTLDSIESSPEGTRLHVREEPGFNLDPRSHEAHYYQFPRTTSPGPHRFRLSQIAR